MVQMEEASPALAEVLLGRSVSLYVFPVASPCLSPANRLLGEDLAGNTYWEFKDVMNAARFRRIVRYDPKTHFSDVQVTREFCRKMQARAWIACLYSGFKGE
jgi:hypothetical protein